MRLIAALFLLAPMAFTAAEAMETVQPNDVAMEADPAPPWTYWAPEGSTVINHPRVDGVWIAEVDGEQTTYYFGDQCKASEYQAFIGRTLDQFPREGFAERLRSACTECAVTSDLRFDRLNVWFDKDTNLIEEVSCG
ncbi:hypothetical protein [Devosia sp.]|uniref:hypothetical protein n=1 Tax=Devosia sp. TaxID=1871048 RepID=UPI001ACA9E7E|nr:hypothetical protein [Devosia sp.]MBN9335055.1 hypothetical protein [Devosia sp.]